MELHHAISGRRTIQRFEPGSIPDEVLERALAAAVFAPNHKTTWPFRFVLPGPAARQRLFEIGLRAKIAKAEARGSVPEDCEDQVRAKMLNPDRLVVVVQVVDDDPHRAEEDYAACCCATYGLMLALHAEGFGTKWGTGATTRAPEAHAALGIGANERVVGFIWAGVAEIVPKAPARPPLSELVRRVG